ncbi:DEAD/DEAH box helicase [Kitasatospora sp. NPDC002040]|uniref:DEAD/DEAH box helicase n=1 Tax=Kitasatospora sp. NPDC002040 TaxID=3154661 RepID=UPI0033300DCB
MTAGVVVGQPEPTVRKPRAAILRAERLQAAARTVIGDHQHAVERVRLALAPLQEALVEAELDRIPLARLKDVTGGGLRLAALEQAGYTTVRQVRDTTAYTLRLHPGVGELTAAQAIGAARQLAEAVGRTVAVRIDPGDRSPAATALVSAVHRLVTAGHEVRRAHAAAERTELDLAPLLTAARPLRGALRALFVGREQRATALEAVRKLEALTFRADEQELPTAFAQASVDLLRPPVSPAEAWIDFELYAAEFYTVLDQVTGSGPAGRVTSEGDLPQDLAERIRAEPLDDTHSRISLRGYQAFGVRFALAQQRVIIGDEMGLGKTVQAVAAMAHLRSTGRTRFLVVCPAGVLVNWTREIESGSTLPALRLHGPERDAAVDDWRGRGGVGVTTYEGLRRLDHLSDLPVGMLVVDEAHFIKNRTAQRSRAVAEWAEQAEHVLFLTGTPMENRVEEFRSLVQYLQPDLLGPPGGSTGVGSPAAFRKAVAPAYLRRNQQDVLAELPAVVQVDAWEEFSPTDQAAYRSAVASGNFMAMRRAAYADPAGSAKLLRLKELVREAAENGLKVIVFSYFKDVLATVQEALGGHALGPIHGGLAAARRQDLVDRFGAEPGHAVLLGQIQAGGIGLNIQAASVVILCEPQVKPTLESQAVARAHRMGQVRPVQVHRLLATDSVDQRMVEILRAKSREFDHYARRSETAESTPEAVDISERSLAVRIVEEEQLRLALTTS